MGIIETILTIVLAVAVATERIIEIVKPLYLRTKNTITKREASECTKTEKIIMSVLTGPIIAILSGVSFAIPELPVIAQQILIGLFASLGSNAIHAILSLVVALKDAAEGVRTKDT